MSKTQHKPIKFCRVGDVITTHQLHGTWLVVHARLIVREHAPHDKVPIIVLRKLEEETERIDWLYPEVVFYQTRRAPKSERLLYPKILFNFIDIQKQALREAVEYVHTRLQTAKLVLVEDAKEGSVLINVGSRPAVTLAYYAKEVFRGLTAMPGIHAEMLEFAPGAKALCLYHSRQQAKILKLAKSLDNAEIEEIEVTPPVKNQKKRR
jgi:hypothetical protein